MLILPKILLCSRFSEWLCILKLVLLEKHEDFQKYLDWNIFRKNGKIYFLLDFAKLLI